MDITRARPKRRGRLLYGAAAVVALALAGLGLGRLKAAPPAVERSTLWIGTVKRGPMLRQVKGPGALVPERVRLITAEMSGRVERVLLEPGAEVTADTLLVELTNPDVVLQALTAERDVASDQAELLQIRGDLQGRELTERSAVATLGAELTDARRRASAYRAGAGDVVTELEARQIEGRLEELTTRMQIAERRVEVARRSLRDELAAQRAQIARGQDVAAFRRRQVDAMRVRAGDAGVLQDLPLELGQWVTPGTLLAKVVQPGRLKAVIRVAELSAKDLQPGQRADVDTRNGVVAGRVARVATAANQGTVTVEVSLEEPLPKGARPDLTVEGTITIDQIDDTLYVDRPAGAQPDAAFELFKLSDDGRVAARAAAELGKGSVGTIEVKRGLREGDRVILSDMSRWDGVGRVAIE